MTDALRPTDRNHLTEVSTRVRASAARVFAELSDGWAYAGWVVGATHIRDVDADWPAVGSRIHHMVGAWPFVVSDHTECLLNEPGRRLVLRARGWPLGEAVVDIALDERGPSDTIVTMGEAPTAGPGKWLDNPLLRASLKIRNEEALRRLRDRVENRVLNAPPPEPA